MPGFHVGTGVVVVVARKPPVGEPLAVDTSLVVVEEDTYFAADWGTYFVVEGGNPQDQV